MKLFLQTDGGARGNPGPAAAGIVIKNEKEVVVASYGEFLGTQTNNYAEYWAMISGLKKMLELGATEAECTADSLLVVQQLNRKWKVKEPTLQKLFVIAWNEMQKFRTITIRHVLRHKNKEPDHEVNKILDAVLINGRMA